VKGFLGLCQYYANFCPNFAELADPLYRLTEKSKAKMFQWPKEAELAFSKLKSLDHPTFTLLPYLYSRTNRKK